MGWRFGDRLSLWWSGAPARVPDGRRHQRIISFAWESVRSPAYSRTSPGHFSSLESGGCGSMARLARVWARSDRQPASSPAAMKLPLPISSLLVSTTFPGLAEDHRHQHPRHRNRLGILGNLRGCLKNTRRQGSTSGQSCEWKENVRPWMDSRAFHGRIHSPLIRRTVAENGPCHF